MDIKKGISSEYPPKVDIHSIYINEVYTNCIFEGDIESGYEYTNNFDSKEFIICPKGKNHPYIVTSSNEIHCDKLIPNEFEEKEDWELKCFWEIEQNFLFIGYLQSEMHLYKYDLQKRKFISSKKN